MEYLTDSRRHLICRPYSIPGLHAMAADLGIARCWYHGVRRPHYDVPVRRQAEIANRCVIVSSREIVRLIDEVFGPNGLRSRDRLETDSSLADP